MTELTPATDTTISLNPDTLYGQKELAKVLATGALLPQALRGKPADVLITVMYGRELGLTPMQSIQGIYVVNGRPSLSGKLLLAKVRQAGHKVKIAADAKRAVVTITRHDDAENPHAEEFTWADAERAKLTGKDTWKQWPKQMLTWRALSNAVNFACPEVAMGFEVLELVQDDTAPERPSLAQVAAQRTDTTPAPAPAPAASAPAGVDTGTGEVIDAEVDDEEIAAAVAALHTQATRPADDSGWPTVAPIPGMEDQA